MSTMTEAHEKKFGKQALRFEPPDLIVTVYTGKVAGEEMEELCQYTKQLVEASQYRSLVDLTSVDTFSSEAKKVFGKIPLPYCSAIFGASTQFRVVASLLTKVYNMMQRGAGHPISFFDTEAAARVWLEEQKGRAAQASG
jgi:hypothetical protein